MPPRTVIVSGASSGIGLATAHRFAAAGDRVLNFDLRPGADQDAPAEWVDVDVTDWSAVRDAVDDVVSRYGGVDVAIANAGISLRRTFLDMTETEVRAVLGVNLFGVMALWQAAARPMVEARSGTLLATASTNGSAGYPYYADSERLQGRGAGSRPPRWRWSWPRTCGPPA